MENDIERLRAMLGAQDVWEKPAESDLTPDLKSDTKRALNTDETLLLYGNEFERGLNQCIEPAEGKTARHFKRTTFD